MRSFQKTDKKHAKGQQVLGCMWVFTYKTDKHGILQKCKAQLVVWRNQQAQGDLPTRATTLASMTFCVLMAITAKFDLETAQMDAVNAFVNCDLDEVVYMRMPPGFESGNKVFCLIYLFIASIEVYLARGYDTYLVYMLSITRI